MSSEEPPARNRNPKGQGERLRGEILDAGRRILERAGTEEAVTLRATAREGGITAPAIYAHFSNRDEMVEAIIAVAFADFAGKVIGAMTGIGDPGRRLRAACQAYVAYGLDHPATYRIIFARDRPSEMPGVAAAAASVFQTLVDLLEECAEAGLRRDTDAREDAATLWLGMHGLASLPPSHPRFPWPDQERLLDRLLVNSAGLEP